MATPTKIDELVVEKLRKLGVVPSETCTDAEFLRRVSLDMTGTLPTGQQVAAFLADTSPNKRAEKVDELLSTPGLCRLVDDEALRLYRQQRAGAEQRRFQSQGGRSARWYDWIYKRVADNIPYDELVAGIVLGNQPQCRAKAIPITAKR